MPQSTGSTHSLEEVTIVDADVHLQLRHSLDQVSRHLDPPYKQVIDTANPWPSSGWDRRIGGKLGSQSIDGPEDIESKLCDEFHIDVPILNAFAQLGKLADTDLAVALMEAFNNTLIDEYLATNRRFHGLIEVATADPERSAEEIDRIGGEDQVVGVFVGNNSQCPPLGDPAYDPIYRAAEDQGLAIVYHSGSSAFQQDFPIQNRGVEKFLEAHVLAHPWSHMLTLTSLLVNGTPEKFPSLDFVFLEAGIAWLPYMMYRLNKEYSIRRSEAPLLQDSPEEYIRDSVYVSTQPIGEPESPDDLASIVDLLGVDRIMFSTDYPHWDFDHPAGFDQYIRAALPAAQRKQILHGNAVDVFGLNI